LQNAAPHEVGQPIISESILKEVTNMARILLIDDEQHIRDRFDMEMTGDGYAVQTIGSCWNFIPRIELFRPELVVLDIKLAGCDGLDILEEIRNYYPDLPVILWSAYDTYKYEIRSIGADYYVLKSYDLTELKTRVRMSLETAASPAFAAA
jgi:two-component system, response regulator, stage 0 sporulation protein F